MNWPLYFLFHNLLKLHVMQNHANSKRWTTDTSFNSDTDFLLNFFDLLCPFKSLSYRIIMYNLHMEVKPMSHDVNRHAQLKQKHV